jgi:hypothetical protein
MAVAGAETVPSVPGVQARTSPTRESLTGGHDEAGEALVEPARPAEIPWLEVGVIEAPILHFV